MLQSNTTIRLLWIECVGFIRVEPSDWKKQVQYLYEIIFTHPSLEHVKIDIGYDHFLVTILKGQKKTLIDMHRKEQSHVPLPIVRV